MRKNRRLTKLSKLHCSIKINSLHTRPVTCVSSEENARGRVKLKNTRQNMCRVISTNYTDAAIRDLEEMKEAGKIVGY